MWSASVVDPNAPAHKNKRHICSPLVQKKYGPYTIQTKLNERYNKFIHYNRPLLANWRFWEQKEKWKKLGKEIWFQSQQLQQQKHKNIVLFNWSTSMCGLWYSILFTIYPVQCCKIGSIRLWWMRSNSY